MFLAMLGVYGVTAFAVHRRRREVAVRLAIGATSRQVVRMFIGEHGALLAVGLGLGLSGGALVGRLLGGHLHEVEPLDPWTFLTCGLLVACTVWLATWWPARRATRRTPFAALHET
jgi:ABC-type antimicrobial peptide transport system permease subunit